MNKKRRYAYEVFADYEEAVENLVFVLWMKFSRVAIPVLNWMTRQLWKLYDWLEERKWTWHQKTHFIETQAQSIEERVAKGETSKEYAFSYEHGEGKRGSIDISAYDVQDAFSVFGYLMKVHKLHPRNIYYEIIEEVSNEQPG